MEHKTRVVAPTFPYDMVELEDGSKAKPPEGWELLKPGDATLTRRVKKAGPSWTVEQKKGRKTFSHGVWAPAEIIKEETEKLEAERETPAYKKKRKAALRRQEEKHQEYVEEFFESVLAYLNFHESHSEIAHKLARAVTEHATPVGSGTVARTKRIPVEERASAAVIAWMRHQTTAYDQMHIPRVKGQRREVRRKLAARSKALLNNYREGLDVPDCPLRDALGASS